LVEETDGIFPKRCIIKYYRDVHGVEITISINYLGTEGNKSKIVLVMGYIGTKAFAHKSNSSTRSKIAIHVELNVKGKKDHVTIEIVVVESKLSRGD